MSRSSPNPPTFREWMAQKVLTTPNRFRKFMSIRVPGGVSCALMGLLLTVSEKEYRNAHPLLIFTSMPTATWSVGLVALKRAGGLMPLAIPPACGSADKWKTPLPTERNGRTLDDRGLKY